MQKISYLCSRTGFNANYELRIKNYELRITKYEYYEEQSYLIFHFGNGVYPYADASAGASE